MDQQKLTKRVANSLIQIERNKYTEHNENYNVFSNEPVQLCMKTNTFKYFEIFKLVEFVKQCVNKLHNLVVDLEGR